MPKGQIMLWKALAQGRYYLPHSTIVSFIREVVIIVVTAFL